MDKLEKAIAAVKYGIRAAECAGNGKNLGRSSFVMMHTDDLDDILDVLKAQELPDVKPEKLGERTTKWLDQKTAEERLEEIAAILNDWDGYRTAKGLAGLINEVWAYALYPVKAQEPDESKYEYHTDHTDCPWYITGEESKCPVTCSQYRDGWNDAMNFIFRNGDGYRPYDRIRKGR